MRVLKRKFKLADESLIKLRFIRLTKILDEDIVSINKFKNYLKKIISLLEIFNLLDYIY